VAKTRVVQIELSEKQFSSATQLAALKGRTVAELVKRQLKKRIERFEEKRALAEPELALPVVKKTRVRAASAKPAAPLKKASKARSKATDDGDDR